MTQITDAFEDLSHALRVLLEAHAHAHGQGLLQLDRAEAVGNIEMGLAAVLNAFHSLYDAMGKQGQSNIVDWHKTPELVTVIALRNARHHNHAKKIRTVYSYYAQETRKIGGMERYIFVDFPATGEDADTFDVYLSWGGLREFLMLTKQSARIQEATVQSIKTYIGSEKIKKYALHYNLPEDRIFINAVPLLVNAAVTIVPLIKNLVSPRSMEGETYLTAFQHVLPADTVNHEVQCGPFALVR